MSQMVRAQLIFDRRTPASGMPVWRDADGGVTNAPVDARVGAGVAEFLLPEGADVNTGADADTDLATPPAATPTPFAQELAERLQLACERVDAEHAHLAEVGTVAAAYLGRPRLRLVK